MHSIIKGRYVYIHIFNSTLQRMLVIVSHFDLEFWKQTYISVDGSLKKVPSFLIKDNLDILNTTNYRTIT